MIRLLNETVSTFRRAVISVRHPSAKIAPSAMIGGMTVRGAGSESILEVGSDSVVSGQFCFDRPNATIKIGKRTFVGRGLLVAAQQIDIGDDVLISWDVTVVDHHSHSLMFAERQRDVLDWRMGHKVWDSVRIAPVTIKSKSWIGFGASILPGVCIGTGAIVGACSVVTKDVPDWTIVAGNPARAIGSSWKE